MSKITFRFSLSEVWSPKNGMNSFWGKHPNSSRVSFFIVWSTPFWGMTTLSLDFCWFLVAFEKFTIENSSTIHSFWIFWQKNPEIWWVDCGGFWTFFWILAQCAPPLKMIIDYHINGSFTKYNDTMTNWRGPNFIELLMHQNKYLTKLRQKNGKWAQNYGGLFLSSCNQVSWNKVKCKHKRTNLYMERQMCMLK